MPCLVVTIDQSRHEIAFAPGQSVRETLERSGLRVRSGCRGDGACGLCLVEIEDGQVEPPTRNETLTLSAEQLEQNVRLACQVIPQGDLDVRIISPMPPPKWRAYSQDSLVCAPSRNELPAAAPLVTADQCGVPAVGVAIDLGTTQISISLWDLENYRRLDSRIGLNPQSVYGSDVVTRLIAAGESLDNARRIAWLPLEGVYEALVEMCSQSGLTTRDIGSIVLVGNTAMLALLSQQDPRQLLESRFWNRHLECKPSDAKRWANALGLKPEATFEVVEPLAGFVGSDLLAGVVAVGLLDEPGTLLIDFGTNSEMALWDGKVLWVTSASGGPAFEGCGIRCGMPGEPGAICRVEAKAEAPTPSSTESFVYSVIGGGEPRGICGSGLVDLIALLRRIGYLDSAGRFGKRAPGKEFVMRKESPSLTLTKGDVDVLQRAKAAIGAGISMLLSKARLSASDLKRVCVSGAFGHQLDVRNAQSIGLLPNIDPSRVCLCGNTSLAGCERLLLLPAAAKKIAALRQAAVMVNLSEAANFDELFMEHLYLEHLRSTPETCDGKGLG